MKNKPSKKITSLLLAFVLAVGMVALPSTALTGSAARIANPDTIAADETGLAAGSTIYFGSYPQSEIGTTQPSTGTEGVDWAKRNASYNNDTPTYYKIEPIEWRVLSTDNGELFLVADQILDLKNYHTQFVSTTWENSVLRTWLNGDFYNTAFSTKEQDSISSTLVVNNNNPDHSTPGGNDTTDMIFLLSLGEVTDYNAQIGETPLFTNAVNRIGYITDYTAALRYMNKGQSFFWWLRSAGNYNTGAVVVGDDGRVYPIGNVVGSDLGVRPAFKINLTSVIFSSSAASGGKPTGVGANLEAAMQPTAEIKLTVLDTTNLALTIDPADRAGKTAAQGETITISYTGAVAGTGKFVSCVVEQDGVIKYYAKLATAASGSATIKIPTDMPVGNYTIKLFNEQCNANNYTDFASAPIAIQLTVQAPTVPTIGGGAAATTDSIDVIEGYPEETKPYTIEGTPAPNVTIADDGTGASVTNAGELTIPAGLGVGTYNIVLTATNSKGDATMAVTLTVKYAPVSITTQPANATIIEGANASFSITAAGSATLTYQWEEVSDNGTSWNTIPGETSAALALVSVPLSSNGKQYRCVVDNPLNTPVTSTAAALTVLEAPTVPTVAQTSLALLTGATGRFEVFMGTGTDKAASVSIASSDTAVAMVDTASLAANGSVTVTGVAEGTTNINLTWVGGSQGGATTTVAVIVTKTPPPPVTQHTITLGASGGGTVSGGGSYAENDTAKVAATPNEGYNFKQWTESGAVVSTKASYSFAVTGARTLTAVFEKNDSIEPPIKPVEPEPEPPVITYPSGGGSSGSSGGSNKADTSPNLKPPATGRSFTKPEATKLFNAALAAKPEGQTTLSIRAQNYTKVDKTVFTELAALAKKSGVTLTVHFDTVVGKAVTYRVSVNPAVVSTSLDVTAKLANGKMTLPKLPVAIEIAVKMPVGVTMKNLKITQNGKDITVSAKPWLDKNGYLHFTTTGGEIVLGK